MARKKYKLTLHYRLQKLPHEDYRLAMDWLPNRIGIHRSTWERWIYLREDDPAEVPANAIIQMAIFFQCEPSEMFTNPVNKEEMDADWKTYKNQFNDDLEFISTSLNH